MRIITTLTRQTRQYTINLIWIAFLLAEHNGQITTTTKTTIRSRNFSMSNNFASKIFFVSHSLNARCDWIQLTKRGKVNARDGIYFLFSQSCTTRFVSLRMWKSINQIAIRITYTCFDAVALALLVIVKHRTLQRNVIWIDRINPTNKRMRKVCKCKYQKRMERTSG